MFERGAYIIIVYEKRVPQPKNRRCRRVGAKRRVTAETVSGETKTRGFSFLLRGFAAGNVWTAAKRGAKPVERFFPPV